MDSILTLAAGGMKVQCGGERRRLGACEESSKWNFSFQHRLLTTTEAFYLPCEDGESFSSGAWHPRKA